MAKKTSNYANADNSDRLQRVLLLLSDGQWHGTREIMRTADVCAVNSVIHELRCNKYDIVSRCAGKGRYEYRLLAEGQLGLF